MKNNKFVRNVTPTQRADKMEHVFRDYYRRRSPPLRLDFLNNAEIINLVQEVK